MLLGSLACVLLNLISTFSVPYFMYCQDYCEITAVTLF